MASETAQPSPESDGTNFAVQRLTIKSRHRLRQLSRMTTASTVLLFFSFVVLFLIGEGFNPSIMGLRRIQRNRAHQYSKSTGTSIKICHSSKISMCQEVDPAPTTEQLASIDYSVGQEYDGTVLRAKAYSVHVNISTGASVVLPRNKHTRGKFEKLKLMALEKSKLPVRVEITEVDAVNGTLKGIYIPLSTSSQVNGNFFDNEDIAKELHGKKLNGTIANVHASGMFVELDEFGIEGLVPSRLCTDSMETHSVKKYKPGMSVEVYIEHVDTANKKLALSMLPAGQQRTDPSAAHLHSVEKGLAELKRIPPQRWLQGVVQRTTAAGLYVRLANRDAIGFVSLSRIPRELVQILTQRVQEDKVPPSREEDQVLTQRVQDDKMSPSREEAESDDLTTTETIEDSTSSSSSGSVDGKDGDVATTVPASTGVDAGGNKRKPESGVEALFSVGDVLRVRVQSVSVQQAAEIVQASSDSAAAAVDGALQLELSMLPYTVDEADGSAATGSSAAVEHNEAPPPLDTIQDRLLAAATGIPTRSHNPEDCLIWWRGTAYETEAARKVRTMTAEDIREKQSREAEDIVLENSEMVAGAWRRVFERDMRQEEEEFSSKGREKEMRELQEEMAGLEGLEDELIELDALQTGSPDTFRLGVFVDPAMIPAEWREELTFYKELEERDAEIQRASRVGKKGEKADFEEAVRKTQLLQQQTAGGRRSGGRAAGRGGSSSTAWSSGGSNTGTGRHVGAGGDHIERRRPTATAWAPTTTSSQSDRVERGRPAADRGRGSPRSFTGPRWRTLSPEEKLQKQTFPPSPRDNANKSQDSDMTPKIKPSESDETSLN